MKYLIWSIEHGAWWCPQRCGYTQNIRDAGRYSWEDAQNIVEDANIAQVNECFVPESCIEDNHQ